MPSKEYRFWSPTQSYLLPPSPLEWLPDGHLAFFILEIVDELDLREIEVAFENKDARGTRPYPPRMMTALLLYGYCVGMYSSRKLARATYEDVAVRVIACEAHPHFTTLADFRLHFREPLARLFQQVLGLCRRAGLVSLGHVSLDGSKVQASASKHKAMSYQRMNEDEKRLQEEVQALLSRADDADREEDAKFGVGVSPEDLPQELRRREDRLAKIREAKAALERDAARARAETLQKQGQTHRERAASTGDLAERTRVEALAAKREQEARRIRKDDDEPPTDSTSDGLPLHRTPANRDGSPKKGAQRNFTDPESKIMQRSGSFMQAFNCQVMVEHSHQIIVAESVSNQAPDVEYLRPMVKRALENLGGAPTLLTADAGYYSDANVQFCREAGIEPFIAIGRSQHRDRENESPRKALGWSPEKARMRELLLSERGRKIYRRRKAIAEPVFAHIKSARRFGRFSLRGLHKVRSEWSLACLCHNLLKLFGVLRASHAV